MPHVFAAVALLVVSLLVTPAVAAQEASPAATPEAVAGVSIEPLALFEVLPGVLVPVVRVELAAGAALAPHTSPAPVLAQVESGQVSYAVITGVAQRARLVVGAAGATPRPATPVLGTPAAATPAAPAVADVAVVEREVLILGEEIPLGPGEGVTFGPDVVHTFRNTGDEPAVLLLIGDAPPEQPVFQFVEDAVGATPAATPAA